VNVWWQKGSENVAIGSASMYWNYDGLKNTAVGSHSLRLNNSGTGNAAFGYYALSTNTSGYGNVAIGSEAMDQNTTGFFNTVIGTAADVASGNQTNSTALGYQAWVDASNKVRIGNAAVTVIEGQVPFTTPSDGRYKFEVREDVKGLDFILALRPVTYQFDVRRFDGRIGSGDEKDIVIHASYDEAAKIRRSGFIAQEVEEAAATSSYDFSGIIKPKTEKDHYGLSYESFVVPLVKAVQEQQSIIQAQNKKLELQQQKMEDQDKKISILMQELAEIKKLIKESLK